MKKKSFTQIETELKNILYQFLSELNSKHALRTITLDAYLDRDLGIDSLSKVEFFRRIEEHFDIQLPETFVAETETLRDIIIAIQKAGPKTTIKKQKYAPQLEWLKIDPSSAETLVDVLLLYAKKAHDRPHIYLQDENGLEQTITYGKLFESAKAIARGLGELRLKKNETVAIMLPTSEAFFYTFFGILLAGGIPVPIYPPFRPDRIGEYAVRESIILRNAEVRFLITFHKAEMLSRLLRISIPSLKSVVTADELMSMPGKETKYKHKTEDPSLIQYTSGSTSVPKGVLLTHQNLLANIHAYGKGIDVQPSDVCVSWLPLYHDMGLIGAWLGSFYYGVPATIMSPLSFLVRPERWLWTIHYHRGTVSAGPNFAYELCTRKIDKNDIEGLDLSSWRLAFNGAEAINPNTVRRFIKKFKPYGFKEESFYPVYGLAESSVALTFPELNSKPRFDKIKRDSFENDLKAIPIEEGENNYLEFVSCGKPLENHAIRIVDNEGNPLKERQVGNLQFKGPSAMKGYYHNNQATLAVYHDGWWDTGDLAYIVEGELFITGRKKDIIIKAGRNYYPEEIEEAASQVEGVRKGCVVAFGVHDPDAGTEKLIIAAETHEKSKMVKEQIISNIRDKITTILGVPPDQVILLPPRTIPKTSSGKLRRSSCKADYLSGKIAKFRTPVKLQFALLILKSGYNASINVFAKVAQFLYSIYVSIMLAITFVPIWLSVVLPSRNVARKLAKFWAKQLFRLGFCSVKITGEKYLHPDKSAIYVINHASYIDALVLLAVLPTNIAIVAKQELKDTPILRTFIKKLGHILVERFDFTKSIADAEKIKNSLIRGEAIAIFPEGTFAYTSGLRPFKLGAFKIAAETNNPIFPIALKGTRKIMRKNIFTLRPGEITVTISDSVKPRAKDWDEITRLRSLVYKEIAKHCGEAALSI